VPDLTNPVFTWRLEKATNEVERFTVVGSGVEEEVTHTGGNDTTWYVVNTRELKLQAPEAPTELQRLKVRVTYADPACAVIVARGEIQVRATTGAPTPISSFTGGCVGENSILVIQANKPAGDIVQATSFTWDVRKVAPNTAVTEESFATLDRLSLTYQTEDLAYVNMRGVTGSPDLYVKVVAANACGTTETTPPAKVDYNMPKTTWLGTTSNDWFDNANWSDRVPAACTDVTIQETGGDVDYYPVIDVTSPKNPGYNSKTPASSANAVCDEITFMPGAGVKGLNKLTYRRAYVKATFRRNQWYTLTAPLKNMYTGDWYYDGKPITYTKKYNCPNPQTHVAATTGWTTAFNTLSEPVQPGFGFAYMVDSRSKINGWKQYATNNTDQSVTFPRMTMDSTLVPRVYDYSVISGELLKTEGHAYDLNPSEDNYRFAWDGKSTGSTWSLTTNAVNGTTYLIGNPVMTHLDLAAWQGMAGHGSMFTTTFRFWNGSTNTGIIVDDEHTATAAPGTTAIVPPMQAFIVTGANGKKVSPKFDHTQAYYVKDDAGSVKLRSTSTSTVPVLYVSGNDGTTTSYLSVGRREGASDDYVEGEDAVKLFYEEAGNEIYTLAGGEMLDINRFSGLPYEAPLAVKSKNGEGQIALNFQGAEEFENIDVVLINRATGDSISLKDVTAYNYAFNAETPENNLFVRFTDANNITTDNEEVENDLADNDAKNIQIFAREGNTIRVMSTSNNPIASVSVFDATGRLIIRRDGIGKSLFDLTLNSGSRAVIVNAVTEKAVKSATIQLR
jgi:hypothetical protein